MRTTVTLDDDVVAGLRAMMRERGLSFKEALNSAVRSGLGGVAAPARAFTQETFHAEIRPGVDLVKALRLAADLEDEEILRKVELGR
jgi:hypothetical protein